MSVFHPETRIELEDITIGRDNLNDLHVIHSNDNWKEVFLRFIEIWTSDNKSITFHSSGTTGSKKSIAFTREHLTRTALLSIRFFGLTAGDRVLLPLAPEYIASRMMLIRAMIAGLNVKVVKATSNPLMNMPDTTFDFALFVPLQIKEMITNSTTIHKVNAIRKIIIGGAPIPEETQGILVNMKNDVYETFGMTETASHIALRKLSGTDLLPYFTTMEGITVSNDEQGRLVVHAPMLSPDNLVTNDCAEVIDDKTFRWLGRYDHLINSGGFKINPELLEEKLEHALKMEIMVAGIPDENLGERLVMVMKGSPDEPFAVGHIRSVLRKILHPYEIPKEFYIHSPFKKNPNGKLLRREMVEDIRKGLYVRLDH